MPLATEDGECFVAGERSNKFAHLFAVQTFLIVFNFFSFFLWRLVSGILDRYF